MEFLQGTCWQCSMRVSGWGTCPCHNGVSAEEAEPSNQMYRATKTEITPTYFINTISPSSGLLLSQQHQQRGK